MPRPTACDPTCSELPPGGGHPNHRHQISDLPAVLDVVAAISNPVRYRSRYDLFRAFERHMRDSGARLTVIELAFGERPWEVTEAGRPDHVQVRTDHELWHKENLINIGIARLPRDWRYVAWVDADITFARPDWAQETLQQLQHYDVVQPWSHCTDLGSDFRPLDTHLSFVHCYHEHPDVPLPDGQSGPYGQARSAAPRTHFWHPGYAWAARREAIDAVGGLIDHAILGAGDHHMAKALVGRVTEAVAPGIGPRYLQLLEQWQDRAERAIRRNVGYVPGTILHHWHGPKVARRYWDRWRILVDNGYCPDRDIQRDWQGLWRLSDRCPIGLRDGIRGYFRGRDEDAA